jgi:hypothetical protein
MASKGLSGLTGTKENHLQGSENSVKAGSSPTTDGLSINYDGPNDHIGLLEYYFGNPTSTKKNKGAPDMSQW